ncbi:hypothetical protein DFH09DRAFT_1318592 [Mycena vulgaris]|nr:hypothetical protein DFH09DRAFT_1411286 [Mycena vulgaris]KAJ6553939.1 hypothetical protein DFH09DRAFT_1318592 [Mycena vulgaris]
MPKCEQTSPKGPTINSSRSFGIFLTLLSPTLIHSLVPPTTTATTPSRSVSSSSTSLPSPINSLISPSSCCITSAHRNHPTCLPLILLALPPRPNAATFPRFSHRTLGFCLRVVPIHLAYLSPISNRPPPTHTAVNMQVSTCITLREASVISATVKFIENKNYAANPNTTVAIPRPSGVTKSQNDDLARVNVGRAIFRLALQASIPLAYGSCSATEVALLTDVISSSEVVFALLMSSQNVRPRSRDLQPQHMSLHVLNFWVLLGADCQGHANKGNGVEQWVAAWVHPVLDAAVRALIDTRLEPRSPPAERLDTSKLRRLAELCNMETPLPVECAGTQLAHFAELTL